MIGAKKLSEIRRELRQALAATADDPLEWLEKRMTEPKTQGSAVSGNSEVLRSLKRFLRAGKKGKSGRQGVGTK